MMTRGTIGLMFALVVGLINPPVLAQVPETGEKVVSNVPIRAITSGKAHWFGYYDKEQFDPTGRYVLAMEVAFEDRTPNADDVIQLGMVDLEDGDRWISLGESRSWSWQQGSMLQWIPGTDSKVIYNDREGDQFISIIKDVFTGETKKLPRAIYCVSPDGKHALSLNFARVQDTRPGYGYHGGVDPLAEQFAPEGDGLWRMNLETGDSKLLFSHAQIAAIPQEARPAGKHWFNHLLYNTDGTRFVFLHRVHNEPGSAARTTRMFTANPDGGDLHVVADHGMISHFIWRDPQHLLAWSREPEIGDRFFVYKDQSEEKEIVGDGVLTVDGHCTYSPDRKWILTDTYPDKNKMQHLYLYRVADGERIELGQFYRPKPSDNEWRCDLHPAWSRDGRQVAIDSMHEGDRRQVYVLDVSGITMKEEDGQKE